MTHYSDKQHGDTLSPTEKPLALEIADELYRYGSLNDVFECADELVRLHSENEALREAMVQALRWMVGDCHAQYLLKATLARAGEKT